MESRQRKTYQISSNTPTKPNQGGSKGNEMVGSIEILVHPEDQSCSRSSMAFVPNSQVESKTQSMGIQLTEGSG